MTSKIKKDRIEELLAALKKAATGDSPPKLDFASKDDDLGRVADAINKLFGKSGKKTPSPDPSPFQTEDALRYRNILDTMRESYFEVDLKGRIVFFTDRVMSGLGYSREELHESGFRKFVDEADAKRVFHAFKEVFLTGRPLHGLECGVLKKSGEKMEIECSVHLMRDGSGQPTGFRGVVRDVSARKRAERDLQEHEGKYRNVLESMEETYLELDLRGNYIFFNDALCRVLGYPREELQNINYRKINPPEEHLKIQAQFREIYRTGNTAHFIGHPVMRRDGSIRHLEMTMALLRAPSGEPNGFCGIARDITEKIKTEAKIRDSERHLRLLTDNISDVIWTMDFGLKLTYMSPSIFRMSGFTPEEIMQIPLQEYIPPNILSRFEKMLARALDGDHEPVLADSQPITFELEMARKGGGKTWVEISAGLNRDESGKPFEIIGVTRDISERKKAEEARRKNETRYRMLAENINDVVWIIGLDLSFKYASPSQLKLLGWTAEKAKNITVRDVVSPEGLEQISRAMAEELALEAGGGSFDPNRSRAIEVEAFAEDGRSIWLELTGTFNRDAKGKPTEILAVGRNISQRKNMERALAENEQRYRMMSENVNDVVWVIGLDLKLKYASPSTITVTGYTAEEAMALTIQDVTTPDSLEIVSRMLAEEIALEVSGEPLDPNRCKMIEIEAVAKSGQRYWLELTATFNRDENGKPTEILAVGRNITQRKNIEQALAKNEKRFRMMAENINDVVWVISKDLKLTYVSPSNIKAAGYTPEEAMNTPLSELVAPESLEMGVNIVAEELALEARGGGDPNRSRTVELEAIAKGGIPIWLEVTGTFNRDEKGNATEILAVGRNITRRKNMERALAESERRYRMIAENMNDIIWVIGLDLTVRYVSPSSVRLTGYTPEEIMQIPVRNLLTPESFELATGRLAEEQELEQSGQPYDPNRAITLEMEAVRKDGSTYWLEITGTFNRDQAGRMTEILVVGRNVTARKKAEKALEESRKLYRIIVENTKDSISLLDLNFNYLYISPSEVRITGYQPDELMKIPLQEQMTPESYGLLEKIFTEEIARECSGEPVDPNRSRTVEIECHHKKGGKVWVELVLAFTRDEESKPVGIIVSARDVTDRREIQNALRVSENRYRMILDNIQEIIWTTDLNLQTAYVSPSCFQITGYTPDEARQTPLSELLTPDSYERSLKTLSEELALEAGGEPVDPYRTRILEVEMYHKKGGTVILEVTATFTRDKEDEAPTGLLLAGRNITERKRAEEEKEKLENQLIQAQKMESVGRLAGGVAHDFNNMLSVILGYVDIAKRRLSKQHPVLNDIGEIEKAALRSRDITSQLLAFSRKQIIAPVVLDLNELVIDTQKALLRLIGEDIHLSFHPGEDLWAVRFDPSQIEQILMNLAVNARDAMPEGGQLTIETANHTLDRHYCETHAGFKPGQYVRLTVSDNGTGMDRETLKYIFEPFFTTKEEGRGTGLGLATVYGIIKQNDGFVNVYSEPGQGTTFAIYFPRTTEEKKIEEESGEEPALTGTGHILLVEDDAMVLEITKEMLENLEYTVTVAKDPLDALSICERDASVDLVITDVVMPVMKGKELRDRLVKIRPDIKVLFMSGYTANVIAQHGVLEKGVHFLQKPFTIKGLGKKVREVLSSR